MDELVEIILELLFEVPLDAAMKSKKLKTGVKTAIFSVFGGGITLFFAVLTVLKWMEQDDFTGAFLMTLATSVLFFGVIFGAIRGHERKWKRA